LHVCFVSSYFPQACGIASYTNFLGEALCSSDPPFQGTVIATEPAVQNPNGLSLAGTFVQDEDYPEQVIAEVKQIEPDLVHIEHEYGIFGYDGRFLELLTRFHTLQIPIVVTMHTVHTALSFNAGCYRPYLRHMLKRVDIEAYQRRIGELADRVIVHQENSIRQVLLRQGISGDKVLVIPHGTRVLYRTNVSEAKQALGFKPDAPTVLAFGYFERSKNLILLIKAFRKVKTKVPEAKLWLSGYVRGNSSVALRYRDRCLKLIKESGLEGDVIVASKLIPEEQVPKVLTAADIACFVYNEDTHSSSGALHLAMGLGKPIVASRIPKFHELSEVSDEILVNPTSVRELHQLLIRMLIDEPFRQYIKQRIQAYALRTSWSCVAQQHKATYDRLLSTIRQPTFTYAS
jgi:glycosyltransferase involved in cell wall biosynthesis